MKPEPSQVEGRVVERHEFGHSVQHQVNWSHVLGAVVLFYAVWRLGPVLADDEEDR